MLQPLAIQSSLESLLAAEGNPADIALVVLSESGAIYAQAHASGSRHDTTQRKRSNKPPALGTIDRLQRRNQPGLAALMPLEAGCSDEGLPSEQSSATLSIGLTRDERAGVLAGVAAQAWTEELARVRRIQINTLGRFGTTGAAASSGPSLVSGASGSGSGLRPAALTKLSNLQATHSRGSPKVGSRVSSDDEGDSDSEQEGTALPVATPGINLALPGTLDIAPLLLEGELGATLVMPLRPQSATQSSTQSPATFHDIVRAPLLLVLSSQCSSLVRQDSADRQGTSSLSSEQWNVLNDCAQSFAHHIAPALRKAFGRGGELLADEGHGIAHAGGATTIFSDDRESLASVEASHPLNNASATVHNPETAANSGISVS